MTEYKKLVALTESFTDDVAHLCGAFSPRASNQANEEAMEKTAVSFAENGDPEQLHALACSIHQSVADGSPRIRKMVLKARETDPNRQIYNEAMCIKIDQLFSTFCQALQQLAPNFNAAAEEQRVAAPEDEAGGANPYEDLVLSGDVKTDSITDHSPALQAEEQLYNSYILNRAKQEAWQSRVAQGLSDVVTFEAQNRSLFVAEEKVARSDLDESKRKDKMRIIHLLEEQEAAKWESELQRRRAERKSLQADTAQIDSVPQIPAVLQTVLSDATMRRTLAAHVQQLIHALLRTPEDINIRRLRNNNEHLVCDYGHPCLRAVVSDSGDLCACASAVHAAELLWCRMGYTIRYTSAANRSIETLLLEKRADTLLLPCGLPLSAHNYYPLGFEDYSERYFELVEPSAMENPDEWMVWYGMMQEMEDLLTSGLTK